MNNKTTLYLSVAVLLAIAGLYFARSSSDKPAPPAGPKTLFDPKPTGITRLELAEWGKPAKVFEKHEDKWQIVEPIKAAADNSAVEAEINRVLDLSVERTYNAGDRDTPGDDITKLQQPPWLAKLTDKDGSTHTVRVGGPVLMARQTFVQLDGADKRIYVVKGDLGTEIQGSLDHFRDPRVASFIANDVVRLSLDGATRMTASKVDGKWTIDAPVKARADSKEITQVLVSLSNARAEKWVNDAPAKPRVYGLDKPRLTVTVEAEHEEKVNRPDPMKVLATQPASKIVKSSTTIEFGSLADEKVYARNGDKTKPWVFTLPKYVFESVKNGAEKFRDKKVVAGEPMRAVKIHVEGPAGVVSLEKKDGAWHIATPEAAAMTGQDRADFAAVDDLLKAVGGLTATAFDDASETIVPDYGFDKGATKLDIQAEGALQSIGLTVGGPTRGGTGVYVRNDRENSIYVVKAESAAALRVAPLSFADRKLLSFDKNQVTQLDIDAEGKSRTLTKKGFLWEMAAPIQGAVEAKVVNDILADVAALDARAVAGTKDDLSKFGLDQPAVRCRVTIQLPAPPPPASSSAPSSSVASAPSAPPPIVHTLVATRHDGKAYVFVEGGTRIAEIDDKILRDLTAEPLEHKVVKLDTSKLNGVELTYPGRSMNLEKKGDDWTLEGEPGFRGDPTKLTQIGDALRDLTTERYADYQAVDLVRYKLDAPAIKVVLHVEGAPATELHIASDGPPGDEAKRRYATIMGTGRVFLIAGSDAAKFDKQIKDLQQGP